MMNDDKTTTTELLRNFVAAAAMPAVITFGAMLVELLPQHRRSLSRYCHAHHHRTAAGPRPR
jgi:hypothetical protein